MKRTLTFGSLLLLLASGCGTTLSTRPNFQSSAEYQNRPPAAESLFTTDEAVLRGANIEQILSSKVVIPPKARLAVLRFGRPNQWPWWSEELARLDENIQNGTIAKLQACPRLTDVSLLPFLMTPEKQSIPYLREAAARYQADLLLVYRSSSRTYTKYRILMPDEVKALCTVEAILLDVRTGIVPFASVSSQDYVIKKSKTDYSISETETRAEMTAVGLGLEKIGADLSRFLAAVP